MRSALSFLSVKPKPSSAQPIFTGPVCIVPDLSGGPLPVPLLFLWTLVKLGSHSWPQSIPSVVSPVLTRGWEWLSWICCPWPSKFGLVWSLLYAQGKHGVCSYPAWCSPSSQVLLSPFQLFLFLSRCMELFSLSYRTLYFSVLNARRFLLAQSSVLQGSFGFKL